MIKDFDDITYFYSIHSVSNVIKTLPNKTSTGIDNIPSIVLKKLPLLLIGEYTIIFNNCINLGYYPTCWKTAKILPILKKGKNPNEPTSYRPISLTPSISKVFESLVCNSIRRFTQIQKIIPNNQYGFRFNHSTTHALNKFSNDANNALYNNSMIGVCLIDIEKAFDSVWLRGFMYIFNKFK